MQRNLSCAAALALVAAALLAGCDKANPPSPTAAAPVEAPAPATPMPVPAATAQGEASSLNSAQQVRVPHMAKAGEPGLDSLKTFEGKYRGDGVDYLTEGVLAERLKALMGPQYDTLLQNLQTQGPLEPAAEQMYVLGNRQHQGGEEMAAVVIDPVRNGLRVWLLSEGKQTVFTDVEGAAIPWPEAVLTSFGNLALKPQ